MLIGRLIYRNTAPLNRLWSRNSQKIHLCSRIVHEHLHTCRPCQKLRSVRIGFGAFNSPNISPPLFVSSLRNFRTKKDKGHRNSPSEQGGRVLKLLYLTYGSFAIGACLVCAILYRQFDILRSRIKGVERLANSDYGGKPTMIKYKDVILPLFVELSLDKIENFKSNDQDIWIVSFPRSGTTWLSEIVCLILNNVDIDAVKKTSLEERVPYFEYIYPGVKSIEAMSSPRLIKSHLPLRLLPKEVREGNQKIIYIARNPKDVCVSYFHFVKWLKSMTRFNGNFEEFSQRFINDKVPYAPWSRHVTEFWEIKDSDNILFLKYEDLINDVEGSIEKVAKFLDKSVPQDKMKEMIRHTSFKWMKYNKMVNLKWMTETGIGEKGEFIRKGSVGDWRNYFDKATNIRVEQMKALKLEPVGLEFFEGMQPQKDSIETVKD